MKGPLGLYGKNAILKLITVQSLLSLAVITCYSLQFHLSAKVLIAHMAVILTWQDANILVSAVLVRFFATKPKTATYIFSFFNGGFLLLCYFSYLLAFAGKANNGRAFSFEMMVGYIRHFHALNAQVLETGIIGYLLVIIFPLLIVVASIYSAPRLTKSFHYFSAAVSGTGYSIITRAYVFLFLISVLLLTGFIGAFKYTEAVRWLRRLEEPVFATMDNSPFQGLSMMENKSEQALRAQYQATSEFDRKNVIILTVDALRPDHLSMNGYKRETSPFLDSLYRNGILQQVPMVFSAASSSFAGVNGILRSQIWSNIGYDDFSIQQLLFDQGYDINFLVSGDHTHFYSLRSFYEKGIDLNYYIDGFTTEKHIVNDDRIVFEGLENIEDYNGTPNFFYFHLNSVHMAGIRDEKYSVFQPAVFNTKDLVKYVNRYDNGVFQADSYIQRIVELLGQKGFLQNSLLIITADHGESFGENGRVGHSRDVRTDQIVVPLFIMDSENKAIKPHRYASTLDVAPTIIDRLGLPTPSSWEGVSLFRKRTRKFCFQQWRNNYSIIHFSDSAVVQYTVNTQTGEEQAYNLSDDLFHGENIIQSMDDTLIKSFRIRLSKFKIEQSVIDKLSVSQSS